MPEDERGEPLTHAPVEWTVGTLAVYAEALRKAEEKFQEERDRRYAEVKIEEEKALKIKETADLAALELAREIQAYKDEKANELREQIAGERNLYVTKDELASAVREINAALVPIGTHQAENVAVSRRSQQISSAVIAWAGVAFVALSVVAGLLIKFA